MDAKDRANLYEEFLETAAKEYRCKPTDMPASAYARLAATQSRSRSRRLHHLRHPMIRRRMIPSLCQPLRRPATLSNYRDAAAASATLSCLMARRHEWHAASCGAMGPLAIQFPTGAPHIHCRRYRRNVSPSEIAYPS